MEPAYIQLVVENLPSISYQGQRPEHSEIRPIEAVNVSRDESNEEPLTRNLEQAPIPLRINTMEIDVQNSNSDEIQANNGLVREEIENEMPTQLEEQQEIKQECQKPPEIEVLFWIKYFVFTFN